MARKLVLNAVQCRHCLEVIQSESVYELVRCKCGKVAVDGGLEYAKRLGDIADYNELAVYK